MTLIQERACVCVRCSLWLNSELTRNSSSFCRFMKQIHKAPGYFQLSQTRLLVNLRCPRWIGIQVFPFTWYANSCAQFLSEHTFSLVTPDSLKFYEKRPICICSSSSFSPYHSYISLWFSISHVMGPQDLSDRGPLVQLRCLHRPYFRWCYECGIQCWVGTCGASVETDRFFGK